MAERRTPRLRVQWSSSDVPRFENLTLGLDPQAKFNLDAFGFDLPTGVDAVLPVAAADPISRAVIAYKLPKVPGATSAWDEASALLDMAAEIEHALMVQYLYSGFATVPKVAGERPGTLLRQIAVEEMGHLLTVTNLRLMLGMEPYLRRQDESPQQGFDPYPFVLEPLSTSSLAKYVAAESPAEDAEMEEQDKATFKAVLDHLGLKNGPLIHRVGLVYMRLFYLFQDGEGADPIWPDAALAADWGEKWHLLASDIVGNLERQSDRAEWNQGKQFIGVKVSSLLEARTAIAEVAGQGEGGQEHPDAGGKPSHFLRFLRLFQIAGSNPLSRPVPTFGVDDIKAEPAVTLNRLFDVRYEMFLIVLQRFFLAKDAQRAAMFEWCRIEMRFVLGSLHRLVLTYPRHIGGDPKVEAAAPYFHMPASPVPTDEQSLVQRYDAAKTISKAIIAAAIGLGIDPEEEALTEIVKQDGSL